MRNILKYIGHSFAGIWQFVAGFSIPKDLPLHTKFGFLWGYYEQETSDFIREQKGRIAIDVGAHIGYYSRLLSRNFDEVYAFEPDPDNFALLVKNTWGYPNIFPIQMALSDVEGLQDFFKVPHSTFRHSLIDEGNTIKTSVLSTTLDAFVERNHLHGIDFVKIDVEGCEDAVLRGMASVRERDNPTIVAEQPTGAGIRPLGSPLGSNHSVQNFVLNVSGE